VRRLSHTETRELLAPVNGAPLRSAHRFCPATMLRWCENNRWMTGSYVSNPACCLSVENGCAGSPGGGRWSSTRPGRTPAPGGASRSGPQTPGPTHVAEAAWATGATGALCGMMRSCGHDLYSSTTETAHSAPPPSCSPNAVSGRAAKSSPGSSRIWTRSGPLESEPSTSCCGSRRPERSTGARRLLPNCSCTRAEAGLFRVRCSPCPHFAGSLTASTGLWRTTAKKCQVARPPAPSPQAVGLTLTRLRRPPPAEHPAQCA